MLRDKRGGGIDIVHSTVIFLILNAIFFVALFIFVARAGSGASFYEQAYAKKIALIIDEARPGTSIQLKIDELYEIADRNRFSGKLVKVDEIEKLVIVNLAGGDGYSFTYFSDYKILVSPDGQNKVLDIEVKEIETG